MQIKFNLFSEFQKKVLERLILISDCVSQLIRQEGSPRNTIPNLDGAPDLPVRSEIEFRELILWLDNENNYENFVMNYLIREFTREIYL